ncbi:MAG: c-type cytochrome [Thermodesulfobacteriota bacterium]
MHSRRLVVRSIPISVVLLFSVTASAGVFDEAKNLKVLPETTTAEELRAAMRSFSRGTGNRCSACHVGEVEADLSTFDFSLDDKEKKLKARKMIELTRDINASLGKVFPDAGSNLVTVTCATCHRGQTMPIMIEDVLQEVISSDGIEKSVEKYRELRDRYYGGYTYDFSERMLMRMVETFGASDQIDAALAYAALNLEFYPQSSRTYVLRGQIHVATGDIDAARSDMEKALEIEPQSQWIRRQLDKLR